jgi:hypothetical protein
MHPLLEKKNTKNQNRGLATGIATDRERERVLAAAAVPGVKKWRGGKLVTWPWILTAVVLALEMAFSFSKSTLKNVPMAMS